MQPSAGPRRSAGDQHILVPDRQPGRFPSPPPALPRSPLVQPAGMGARGGSDPLRRDGGVHACSVPRPARRDRETGGAGWRQPRFRGEPSAIRVVPRGTRLCGRGRRIPPGGRRRRPLLLRVPAAVLRAFRDRGHGRIGHLHERLRDVAGTPRGELPRPGLADGTGSGRAYRPEVRSRLLRLADGAGGRPAATTRPPLCTALPSRRRGPRGAPRG